MTILKVEPRCRPQKLEVLHDLEVFQSIVGGTIEAIYPYNDSVALVCNDEGKILHMEPNRAIRDPQSNVITEVICGTFFICGLGKEDFTSLSEAQLEYYSDLFFYPEIFLWSGSQLLVLQMKD